MKCHKPNTDQEAVINVLVNGLACTEYVLPINTIENQNVLECFIPIEHGDQLTLSGHFSGTVLYGCFDLLSDGSFLGDKRIEGAKTGEVKFVRKRTLDFQKVLDNPMPEGYTSIYEPKKITEGNLQVAELKLDDMPEQFESGDKLGVGSLAIIISVNQKTDDNYHDGYPDMRIGQWRKRGVNVKHTGIRPTHELQVHIEDPDVDVHKNRQSKHRRHFEQTRFGPKPWAKFIFYYRSRAAIESAGCEKRSQEPQALDEADANDVIMVTPESKSAVKKGRKLIEDEHKVEDDSESITVAQPEGANRLFFTPVPEEQPQQPPKKKQKLFGQSLSKMDSPDLGATNDTTQTIENGEDDQMDVDHSDQQVGGEDAAVLQDFPVLEDTNQNAPPLDEVESTVPTALETNDRPVRERLYMTPPPPPSSQMQQDQIGIKEEPSSPAGGSFGISIPSERSASMAPPSTPVVRSIDRNLGMSGSREGTPAAKRAADHSARKAAALTAARERQAKIAAAKKALEEQQRLRDEEERKLAEVEEREIEMIERSNMDGDEELLADLHRQRVETAAETLEVKMARERIEEGLRASEGL